MQIFRGDKHLPKRILVEHVRPYQSNLLAAFFCMLVVAGSTAAFPYLLKPAFDFAFENEDMLSLIALCCGIMATFLLKGAASYGEALIMTSVGQKIIFDLQKRLFSHLLCADLQFFTAHHSGEILSRFTNDINMMRNAVSTTIVGLGKDFLTFVCLAGVMFCRDWRLSFLAFVVFPSAIIPIFLLGRRMKKTAENTQHALGKFSGYLTQIFIGIRVIRAHGAEAHELARLKGRTDELLASILRAARIRSALHPISEFIAGLAVVLVLAYGGYEIIHNKKTTGDLISFLGSLLLLYEPLRRLTHFNANLQEGLASAKRVFELIDTKPRITNISQPIALTENIESIEFKNVYFAYGNEKNTINNVSFEIKKGERVAFVGASGSGKSTIINLITRFYDVFSGEILINGKNIKNINLEHLRAKIALVTQETILFDASFYENIAYGKQSASKDEVISAARAAFAHDFIVTTDNKYNTIIGENGTRISGGQRQRIAIARAILKNAPILLLDEATSALDSVSEKEVQRAIDALVKDRTTIIVAHRLSTIINSDKIYVFAEGRIIEQGNHERLINQQGPYRRLWQNQRDVAI
jgi:subfamily B ATP-binding cassette protein MsbA